ncbi:hypothetical protein PMIN03_003758 [Paraphaeosphaeria minitans]
MARPKRVLSFMSEWGGNRLHRRNTSTASPPGASPGSASPTVATAPPKEPNASSFSVPSASLDTREHSPSPEPHALPDQRRSSRPLSMIQTYQPSVMEIGQDTLPELQRIFTFLNSHSNKLYQEGYFLKFHDTDSRTSISPTTHACETDSCRWPPRSRPRLAGVLCPAGGHHPVVVGRERTGQGQPRAVYQ